MVPATVEFVNVAGGVFEHVALPLIESCLKLLGPLPVAVKFPFTAVANQRMPPALFTNERFPPTYSVMTAPQPGNGAGGGEAAPKLRTV